MSYYFSPYSPPQPPVDPELTTRKIIGKKELSTWSDFPVSEIPEGTTHIMAEVNTSYDDHSVELTFKQEVPLSDKELQVVLSHHKKAIKLYEHHVSKYKIDLAEFEKKKSDQEYQTYLTLKKKYDDATGS